MNPSAPAPGAGKARAINARRCRGKIHGLQKIHISTVQTASYVQSASTRQASFCMEQTSTTSMSSNSIKKIRLCLIPSFDFRSASRNVLRNKSNYGDSFPERSANAACHERPLFYCKELQTLTKYSQHTGKELYSYYSVCCTTLYNTFRTHVESSTESICAQIRVVPTVVSRSPPSYRIFTLPLKYFVQNRSSLLQSV